MTDKERNDYHKHGKPIACRFDDHVVNLAKKSFSSGSIGWYGNGKVKLLVGESYLPVQVSMILTVIGSKNGACPQTAQEAQQGPTPILDGPPYPWANEGLEGAVSGHDGPIGDQTDVSAKPYPKKKRSKTARKSAE